MCVNLLSLVLAFIPSIAAAQVETVVTAKLERYSIAALVVHAEGAKAFRHGIALFPGHPGILKLEELDGKPQHEQRGNFLVRSRRHWLDGETLVAVMDAPSDEWVAFSQDFRATPRYGSDVAFLLREIAGRFGVKDWTLVGTSEGSISAFHVARMNPKLAQRVILTSSLFSATRNGPGLTGARFEELTMPLLWVHHQDDPCQYTSYRDVRRYAEKTMSPLVTVRGGGPEKGGACQAFTAHGFVGVERPVVLAMRAWVKTGTVPADVAP